MNISRYLELHAIDMDLQGTTQEEVLRQLANRVHECVSSLNVQRLSEDLIKREELLSTATGFGLAFPHCYERVKAPVFALGIHRQGIDAEAPDGKPVHILLVVISPENKPEVHLEALSAASRIFMVEETRDQILEAQTPEEIMAIITSAEEKEND